MNRMNTIERATALCAMELIETARGDWPRYVHLPSAYTFVPRELQNMRASTGLRITVRVGSCIMLEGLSLSQPFTMKTEGWPHVGVALPIQLIVTSAEREAVVMDVVVWGHHLVSRGAP